MNDRRAHSRPSIRSAGLAQAVPVAAAICALAATARADLAVTLRPATRLNEVRPVTLADIAVLSGSDAAKAESVVVLPAPLEKAAAGATWVEVDAAAVREALKNTDIAGGLTIAGSACAVRFLGVSAVPAAETAAPAAPSSDAAPAASTRWQTGTVAEAVSARLASHLGVAPEDLRLRFRAAREGDALLAESAASGRRVDIETTSAPGSARQTVRITVYELDRLVRSGTLTADVEVRRQVTVATTSVPRNMPIGPGDLREEARWLPPGGKPAASMQQAAGAMARSDIRAGEIVLAADVQPALAAKRGDVVFVEYLGSGFTLRVRARATASAYEGDEVNLLAEGSEKSFKARMTGKGRAVVVGN